MNLTLQNVERSVALSQETNCFSATICLDGKVIGTAENAGHGGCTLYRWNDRAVGNEVSKWAESLPAIEIQGMQVPSDLDIVVDTLLQQHEERLALKRLCKGSAAFRLVDDKTDSWRVIKGEWTKALKSELALKYGERIERIANQELYGDPA